MQKELTPDRSVSPRGDAIFCVIIHFQRQRWQAGSIVTTVTDLPVASEINDTRTGGFGHVNGQPTCQRHSLVPRQVICR